MGSTVSVWAGEKKVTIIVWGATAVLVSKNADIQKLIGKALSVGVILKSAKTILTI